MTRGVKTTEFWALVGGIATTAGLLVSGVGTAGIVPAIAGVIAYAARTALKAKAGDVAGAVTEGLQAVTAAQAIRDRITSDPRLPPPPGSKR